MRAASRCRPVTKAKKSATDVTGYGHANVADVTEYHADEID
jgi:hypothetical protein